MAGGHVGRFLHACSSAPVQLIGDTPQKDGPASDDAAEALASDLALCRFTHATFLCKPIFFPFFDLGVTSRLATF